MFWFWFPENDPKDILLLKTNKKFFSKLSIGIISLHLLALKFDMIKLSWLKYIKHGRVVSKNKHLLELLYIYKDYDWAFKVY